jgi:hypothetical protein
VEDPISFVLLINNQSGNDKLISFPISKGKTISFFSSLQKELVHI